MIAAQFEERFGHPPQWAIRAPGRVNVIGDHTDYNDGFVLPMAIARHTSMAAALRQGPGAPTVRAYSQSLNDADEFALDALSSDGGWTDYIKGVYAQFLARGLTPQSLDLIVDTNIPIGCGLSSSAALQIAMAKLLQQLAPGLVADDQIAALCQTAEYEFTGMPAGIMDQFCIAHATEGHLLHLDCRSLDTDHVPFSDPDVAVLIVDSNVSRELRDGAYARRRAQCTQACEALGVTHLRDADMDMLTAARDRLDDVIYRRARHVITEDLRTARTVAAIKRRDWAQAGTLMFDSHASLANDFETSVEALDRLVDIARSIGPDNGLYGARMTGGGFGGCVVTLVARAHADDITERLSHDYFDATGNRLKAYLSAPSAGARVLTHNEWKTA